MLANYEQNKLSLTYLLNKKQFKILASFYIGVHRNYIKVQSRLLKIKNESKVR